MRPRRIRHPAPHLLRDGVPHVPRVVQLRLEVLLLLASKLRIQICTGSSNFTESGASVFCTRKNRTCACARLSVSGCARVPGLASFPLYGLTKNWCATYWPRIRAQLLDAQVKLGRTHSTGHGTHGSPPRTRPRTAEAGPRGWRPPSSPRGTAAGTPPRRSGCSTACRTPPRGVAEPAAGTHRRHAPIRGGAAHHRQRVIVARLRGGCRRGAPHAATHASRSAARARERHGAPRAMKERVSGHPSLFEPTPTTAALKRTNNWRRCQNCYLLNHTCLAVCTLNKFSGSD